MNYTRYFKIIHWARKRYGEPVILRDRFGIASRYTIIETLAAEKYMDCSKRTRSARLAYPPVWEAPTGMERCFRRISPATLRA